MTPYQRARAVYDSEPCARSFEEDLTAHLLAGFVISTPDVFAMFRPVRSTAPAKTILDPWISHRDPDCWHIYLAAGDLAALAPILGDRFELVSFERKNSLRFRYYRILRRRWTLSARTSTRPSSDQTDA